MKPNINKIICVWTFNENIFYLARNSRIHTTCIMCCYIFCNILNERIFVIQHYIFNIRDKQKFTWHSVGHLAVCCEHSLSLSLGNAKRSRGSFNRAIDRDVCASVLTSSWLVFRLFDKKLPRKPMYKRNKNN